MTLYDLLFFVLFFGVLGTLALAGMLSLLGHKRASRMLFGALTIFPVAYVCTWVAVAALVKQKPLGVGDPQCVDNWCIAVENVETAPRDSTNVYDVTLCLFSRANRTPTSFGAHAAADDQTDVYLLDGQGRRYNPLPHASEIPLNVRLQPGQAVRTRRTFAVPASARGIGLLPAGGSFGACPMIGECTTSHSAADYVLASGVYGQGSSLLALVTGLRRNAQSKPDQWK